MSQYANYAHTSGNYDTTRVPIGVETILACLARTGVPLGEQIVLEAGCGTGNYLHALRPHMGSVVGIDFSQGMLDQARAKLGEDVELVCGSILSLPFDDGSLDGITCNQVLHHLDEGPGAEEDPATWEPSSFPNVIRFTNEAYRVLRVGGALVINVTIDDQYTDGFWWADLIPSAMARVRCRIPDGDRLRRILTQAGFEIELISPNLDGVLQGPSYLDPTGPLSEAWRAGDSAWSLTSDAELGLALQRTEQLNRNGTMLAYLDQREKLRHAIGQTTFLCGRK